MILFDLLWDLTVFCTEFSRFLEFHFFLDSLYFHLYKMVELNSTDIEWEKYNMLDRIVFWIFLNYRITGLVLLVVVTIIMLVNCTTAYSLLEIEKEV